MLNTGYSDYPNEDIMNGTLLNNDTTKLHHPTPNPASNLNDKNKNYFHLCHICGNGFPKASIPSHQKMCMKKHFSRPNQYSSNLFNVNSIKNQILYNNPTYPCSNCFQQVPYNKLSSHLRTCKGLHSSGNGKHLEKLNMNKTINVMPINMSNGKLNQLNLLPPISSTSNENDMIMNGNENLPYPNPLYLSNSNRNSMVIGNENSYPYYQPTIPLEKKS